MQSHNLQHPKRPLSKNKLSPGTTRELRYQLVTWEAGMKGHIFFGRDLHFDACDLVTFTIELFIRVLTARFSSCAVSDILVLTNAEYAVNV